MEKSNVNLEKNYSIFKSKLKEVCGDSLNMEMLDSYEEKIKNASFSLTNENNLAYGGSLLQVVLRTFIPFALNINKLLPQELKVEDSSIIKVGLLIHLSKCEMFVPNQDEWQADKLGRKYVYQTFDYALKMGMHSIILSRKLNIDLTPHEYEAITVLDRENDKQTDYYSSALATIIKQANQLTNLKNRYITD